MIKSQPSYSVLPHTPNMGFPPDSPQREETSEKMYQGERETLERSKQNLAQSNQYLKTKIRILRLISRLLGTVLAGATLYLESRTIYSYATTHTIMRNNRGPWARQTSLWPSIMLLASSGISIIIGLLTMAAYTRSIRAANNINFYETIISYTIEVTHILSWIVVAVLYRTGKTGHDLWGWACSPLARKIEPSFEGVVDFATVCRRGTTNWALGVANPAVTIFNLCIWLVVFQRIKYMRAQEKLEKDFALGPEEIGDY
ncbi:hypothetical protein ONS95_010120 [Cadophora gregata]|uniref:uncharacterized protein n=1 Tax=Cadophora gregata TaxID=51156 RepID=UPI0026DC2A96|nr:uncharacterized protein ONS95_010120 [Cadophora gregata]KAK0121840.1 hypothetical protein ONS95_010120 [Cadophora gregata]